MLKYNYIDKQEYEYLIAKGKYWRIWNNGVVESLYREKWEGQNSNQSWKDRLKFLKCWERAEIGKMYSFIWIFNKIDTGYAVKFLGFREQCPECKKSYMVWEGKIQLCKGCDYIHAFEYDDS